MIRVNNRGAIRNLSRRSLRAGRGRNLAAILAIALTTTLITTLFTVGGSLVDTMQNSTCRQVGTTAHGGFKFLTMEQYDLAAADSEVKDISYNILVGFGENPELEKVCTEVRYTEEKDAAWGFCAPTTGTLPVEKYDLATDTEVLDALGIPHELGQTVPLTFSVHGEQLNRSFTLCGFWEGSAAMGAHEVFLSREYTDEVCPVITEPLYESGQTDFSGTVNASLWFSDSWDIDSRMEALKDRCGFDSRVNEGVNWAYTTAVVDGQSLFLMGTVLLLISVSGYLIIYNVFQISVAGDIRFYGLLKTIGTTGKQLKAIVRRQALLLCLAGIPAGLLAGCLAGRVLLPILLRVSSISDCMVVTADPRIFLGAALFALLTVLVSCIRPCRLAARVSPVEAVRYTGVKGPGKGRRKSRRVTPFGMAAASLRRDRKKAAVAVLSLTLSLVLLNGTYSIVTGFDLDKYVAEFSVSDFSLTDSSLRSVTGSESVLDGVSEADLAAVRELPGLERMGAVWGQCVLHTLSDRAAERAEDIVSRWADELPSPYADEDLRILRESHQLRGLLYGMDEALWDTIELHSDGFDHEKFASGDYVVTMGFDSEGKELYYRPGEQVTLDFGGGRQKTYTVLAIGEVPYALSTQFGYLIEIGFLLPADEYRAQVGETNALSVAFDVDDAHLQEAGDWCAAYTEGNSLACTSRDSLQDDFRTAQRVYWVAGGSLSVLLGLIGILNFANAIITSVNTRRRELAMLQSVGMTGRQLRAMLRDEGLLYAGATLLLTATAGSVLCWGLVKLLTVDMWFVTWHFSLLPLALCAVPILALCALVPEGCWRRLSRQTVVERLAIGE